MKKCTIVALCLFLTAASQQAKDEPLTEVIDQEIPFSAGGAIFLKNNDGSITVEGWDRDVVSLHIVKSMKRPNGERANEIFQKSHVRIEASSERIEVVAKMPELQRGVGLSVDADFPFVHFGRGYRGPLPHFDYEVKIPKGVALQLKNDDGAIRVDHHKGDLEVHADDGEVVISDVEAERFQLSLDDGTVNLQTIRASEVIFSGDDSRFDGEHLRVGRIQLRQDDGRISVAGLHCEEMKVTGDDGRVEAELLNGRGRYRFEGDDGTIALTLPEDTSLTVLLLMDDGSLDSDFPMPTQRFKSGERFEATIGSGEGHLEVHMDDGSLALKQQL